MKHFSILILFLFPLVVLGQQLPISIWENGTEIYSKIPNEKNAHKILDSLVGKGFYTLKVDSISTQNQKQIYYINKGKLYTDYTLQLDSLASTTIVNPNYYKANVEVLQKLIQEKLNERGYAFNKVSSSFKNDTLFIRTSIQPKRTVNGIVVKSDSKFPKGFLKELNHLYTGQTYTDNLLQQINSNIQNNKYLELQKNSQVLFLKDSTILYIYPKKKKQSYFDGILGFSNSNSDKIKLTGNLDLQLGNVFNSLEEIQLKWNSSVNQSQDLKFRLYFPYIKSLPVGWESNLKMFRQDSTFVNIDFQLDFYYKLNLKTSIGLYGNIQSSTYLEKDSLLLNNYEDYEKSSLGISYQYQVPNSIRLFEDTFLGKFRSGFINSKVKNLASQNQYFLMGEINYIWKLNAKNYLKTYAKYENLLSDSYLNNELFRVGGIYSLRGFNENSILTNSYFKSTLEYRFLPNEALYLSAFTDFGQFQNKIEDASNFLIGTGVGINFITRFGLFSLQYAIGKFPNLPFQFNNSKIHIGVRALF